MKLLRVSIDLTELVEDPLKGMDGKQSVIEFGRRLSVIQSEFECIEPEVFNLETVEGQACVLECARLWTRLRKLQGTRSAEADEDFEGDYVGDALMEGERYKLRSRATMLV